MPKERVNRLITVHPALYATPYKLQTLSANPLAGLAAKDRIPENAEGGNPEDRRPQLFLYYRARQKLDEILADVAPVGKFSTARGLRLTAGMSTLSQDFAPTHNNPEDNHYADVVARLCAQVGVKLVHGKDINWHLKAVAVKLGAPKINHDVRPTEVLAYLLAHYALGVEV